MPSQSRVFLRWSGYEHEHIERGSDWFWALGVIAVCAAVISVLFSDALFGLLVVIAAITIALLAQTPPELATFELSERGLRVNGTLHRFDEILAFWVEDEHHTKHPLLLVDTVKFMVPNIVIPLEHVDPHVVREFMKRRAKEVPMKEPLPHRILEVFGL